MSQNPECRIESFDRCETPVGVVLDFRSASVSGFELAWKRSGRRVSEYRSFHGGKVAPGRVEDQEWPTRIVGREGGGVYCEQREPGRLDLEFGHELYKGKAVVLDERLDTTLTLALFVVPNDRGESLRSDFVGESA